MMVVVNRLVVMVEQPAITLIVQPLALQVRRRCTPVNQAIARIWIETVTASPANRGA